MTKLVATTDRARRKLGEKPFTAKNKAQEKLLRAIGWVEDAPSKAKAAADDERPVREVETRSMKAETEAEPKKRGRKSASDDTKPKRAYKRRDLKSED